MVVPPRGRLFLWVNKGGGYMTEQIDNNQPNERRDVVVRVKRLSLRSKSKTNPQTEGGETQNK